MLVERQPIIADASARTSVERTDPEITAGYGACKGCDCKGFKGRGGSTSTYICECGHHFSIHG